MRIICPPRYPLQHVCFVSLQKFDSVSLVSPASDDVCSNR